MRVYAMGLVVAGVLATGCASKAGYMTTPKAPAAPKNLTKALSGFGLFYYPTGKCELVVATKSGKQIRPRLDEDLCRDAELQEQQEAADRAMHAAPSATPAPAPTPPTPPKEDAK